MIGSSTAYTCTTSTHTFYNVLVRNFYVDYAINVEVPDVYKRQPTISRTLYLQRSQALQVWFPRKMLLRNVANPWMRSWRKEENEHGREIKNHVGEISDRSDPCLLYTSRLKEKEMPRRIPDRQLSYLTLAFLSRSCLLYTSMCTRCSFTSTPNTASLNSILSTSLPSIL